GKTADELGQDAKDGPGQDGQGQEGQGEGEGEGDADADGQDSDSESNNANPGKGAGKGGSGNDLENAVKQGWQNYPAIVARLLGPIKQVARIFKKIQERQIEKVVRRSDILERLPEGNDLSRLDRDAHGQLVKKWKTGQKTDEQDLNRFA